jgi:PAS domain S-box-containing protein
MEPLAEQFGGLLESMPDGIIMADRTGSIMLANSQAEKLFGYDSGELLGKSVEELIPQRLRGNHVGHRAQYAASPHTRPMGAGLELFGLRKNGSEFPIEISLTPLKAAKPIVVSAIRDISGRKRIESELQEKNHELEEINEELQAFSYSVSHDLRAPVRAIDGFARILEKHLASSEVSDVRRAVNRIRHNATGMARLIEALLEFSQINRHSVKRRLVHPTLVVRDVIEQIRPDIAERQIVFDIAQMPACEADPTLLRQVFANLLSNAVKYTRAKPSATIRVASHVENGETVYSVQDNGAGFDMEYAAKLFRVFQRLHSSSEFEGIGIGLALVKRIIDRHDGRIWARAKLTKAPLSSSLSKNHARKAEHPHR